MANKQQERLCFVHGYGENFRNLRKNKGYTLKEFSKVVLMSVQSISFVETEERLPTVEQLNKYMELFGVSLDYLTGRTKTMNPGDAEISQHTGLSTEAINVLSHMRFDKRLKTEDKKGFFTASPENRFNVINAIISNPEFSKLISQIAMLKNYNDLPEQEEKGIDSDTGEKCHNAGYYLVTLETLKETIMHELLRTFENIVSDYVSGEENKSIHSKTRAEYVPEHQQDINDFFDNLI